MEPSTETNGLLRDFVAGAVAGAFAITVSQPLDTVRVRIQQACSASGGVPSALSVLSSMVRKEGLLSPWKGKWGSRWDRSVSAGRLGRRGFNTKQHDNRNSLYPACSEGRQVVATQGIPPHIPM